MCRIPLELRSGCRSTRPFAAGLLLALVLLGACSAGARWEAQMSDGQAAFQRDDLAEAERRFTAAARLAEGFGPADMRRALTAEKLAQLEVAVIQRVGPAPKPLDVAVAASPVEPVPQAIPRAAPAPAAHPEAFAVHLASFRTEDRARRGWRQLQQTFPDLLGAARLTLERADLGQSGVFQRVLGGPFAERAAAKRLCGALKARAQYCRVVKRRSAG
jgi:cell division septation protein DedD